MLPLLMLGASSTSGNWSIVSSPTTNKLVDIYMLSPTEGWAVGENGTIIRWNGVAWENVVSPTSTNLGGVYMVSPTDGWIVGGYGTILRWDGTTWSTVSSPTTDHLFAIYMLSPTEGWIAGDYNIYKWDGVSWSLAGTPGGRIRSIHALSSIEGWAVGYSPVGGKYIGSIFYWNGSSWEKVDSPVDESLADVYMLSPGNGWIVGANGTILRLSAAGMQPSTPMVFLVIIGVIIFCACVGIVIHYRKMLVSKEEAPWPQEGSAQGVGAGEYSSASSY